MKISLKSRLKKEYKLDENKKVLLIQKIAESKKSEKIKTEFFGVIIIIRLTYESSLKTEWPDRCRES